VRSKIKEIEKYHSSALHWNLNELNTSLVSIIEKVKTSYNDIEKAIGVKLHNPKGLDNFKNKIDKDVSLFMAFSREKAEKVQSREFLTVQPKERLSTLTKAKITITNYLGGQYFLTVDEIALSERGVSLIESKHSKNAILPSKSDIKDGLLKMILYCNLSQVEVNGSMMKSEAVLNLTSSKLKGCITTSSSSKELGAFFKENAFTQLQIDLVELLFSEANANKFKIQIQYSA
jgi:hypothetical protein